MVHKVFNDSGIKPKQVIDNCIIRHDPSESILLVIMMCCGNFIHQWCKHKWEQEASPWRCPFCNEPIEKRTKMLQSAFIRETGSGDVYEMKEEHEENCDEFFRDMLRGPRDRAWMQSLEIPYPGQHAHTGGRHPALVVQNDPTRTGRIRLLAGVVGAESQGVHLYWTIIHRLVQQQLQIPLPRPILGPETWPSIYQRTTRSLRSEFKRTKSKSHYRARSVVG